MSDTSRHLPPRRVSASSAHICPHLSAPPATSSARIEALRKLVAAGRYQVSAKWIAHKICSAAGVSIDD